MMFATILKDREEAAIVSRQLREEGKRLVFTNGCFDLIHAGHVDYLARAQELGDALIVGVNDDDSVRRLKGANRPLMPLADRMQVLAALRSVDYVVAFAEDNPAELIAAVKPQVLVKGGDYTPDDVVGKSTVESYGGKVVIIPLLPGRSTTGLIGKIAREDCT
jgi:rfaE bifunctional protein nucleotidyltransferase chain/domain